MVISNSIHFRIIIIIKLIMSIVVITTVHPLKKINF